MTHSMSTVYTYASRKERDRSPDQRALRLFRVLHRWIDHWTRLPTNVLMPCAVENQIAIVTGSRQPTHCYCPSLESARCQNVSWNFQLINVLTQVLFSDRSICGALEKAQEHADLGFFFVLFDSHMWTQWTLNASSVSTRDQSCPGSPPPMLEHKLRVNKTARIKQRGGG